MKVVQINETCGTGSIGRTTAEMAIELERRGNECVVAYASGDPNYNNVVKIGTDFDHKVHAILSRVFGTQGYFSLRATRKFINKLEDIGPDVVHLRNLHSNYINLQLLFNYLAEKNIATVITLHDCWVFTGKCTYYVPANCKKWQKSCGNCPLKYKDTVNPTFFFDRSNKCLSDKKKWLDQIPRLAVVGVSKWVTNEASKSILADRKPVVIYNWIDMDIFKPKESCLRKRHDLSSKFVILMVSSNISKKKGYNVMIELSRSLSDVYQIVVVGKNRNNLEIPDNVIHIPHTNDANQLAEYYSMADVCVNTTKYETFGKVTAEALCCGTPVIVYNNTASPELVGENCGYVVENNDIEGIIFALEKIKSDGKKHYSQNCITFARKNFNKDKAIDSYLDIYNELIKVKR
ncbi:MAG: glycosyltransferase [bacterium]